MPCVLDGEAYGPLTDAELAQRVGSSAQVKKYAQVVDRESAEEKLTAKSAPAAAAGPAAAREEPSTVERVLASSVGKSVVRTVAVAVAGSLARGVMGALLGSPRRRRR